jgi:AcrR family transcriptional regulator
MTLTTGRWLTVGTAGHTDAVKKVVDAAHGLRERKKLRTREAIIDAALDLFEQKGYDATTVEDIAAAADLSPRTFFRYFESKLALIMARTTAKHAGIGPALAARPPDESVVEAVRQVMSTELSERMRDPLVMREFQVMLTTPSLRNLARDHFEDEEAGMVAAIAERLGLPPDDLTAHVITGVISSALWTTVNQWTSSGADIDDLLPMIARALALVAVGVDSAAASAAAGARSRRTRS